MKMIVHHLRKYSTHLMNLNKRHTKQKHAMRIAHNKDKFEHARHLLNLMKYLMFTN